MKLDLPPEEFRAVAEPLLRAVAGQLAQQLAATAAALAQDAAEGYMDKEQAARYLGLEWGENGSRTLEGWMKPVSEGGRGLPHMKIGATVKFKRGRIDAWMLTLERNPVPLLRPLEDAA